MHSIIIRSAEKEGRVIDSECRNMLTLENNNKKRILERSEEIKADRWKWRKNRKKIHSWFKVLTAVDPSLVLPFCYPGSFILLLLWLSLWVTVGCPYLVPITDCSALAWCWDSRLWSLWPPQLPIYPSNTLIHNPTTLESYTDL